jgi:hypothetical protein
MGNLKGKIEVSKALKSTFLSSEFKLNSKKSSSICAKTYKKSDFSSSEIQITMQKKRFFNFKLMILNS